MKNALICVALFLTLAARAVTTGIVPAEGVFRFTFGTDSVADGFAVPASAVYDANHQYANTAGETFTYGFLGTTSTSYKDDLPWSLPSVAYAIDGFKVVQGQSIVLHDVTGKGVTGPSAAEYLPAGASPYEGRYPIRFAMSAEPNAYYAVTCTVVNVSSTAAADVTLFSERCHIQAHHLALAPNETRTFAWSVELAPNVFKSSGTYVDDAINVVVVGENAGLHSLVVVKQPQVAGSVRGVATDKMNVGKTMWLCDDSTGTDQRNDTPYFSLQNYSGVGSGLSRYAPANLAIRNQGEGGLATNANTHRKSCLLKPGDYLYVEYGHNEGSVESFTNNLELYLADANTAKANLIIVSPVERRSSWNSETSTWNRTLQGYAEAGEAWVNAKIAAGARNVAFIDLNKRYNDWMNEELQRIHAVNPAISLNAAISFYHRSAKGANVDNTHINNAGTDQAAYWVWYDALERVAAGERDGATEAERVQAAVLKGITEGYQSVIGRNSAEENLPWQVTDEIISAGAAPNAFWDTPVTAGFAYVHDAAVACVDATANADGSVTLKGVTMRILNPGNYYKAVVEVVSADGSETNRYYSYYNYDVGGAGKLSGDLVVPEEAGFLTADRDKAAVSAPDCAAVTIPAEGKAWIWFAEADAGSWQVGDNAPCSAKVPLEWWSEVVVDEDCSTAENWKVLTQAIYTTNAVDGALSFSSTGANAENTKKNMGLYRALDADVASGRYRISFKALIEAGSFTVLLGDAVNSTTTVFKNSIPLLNLDGETVQCYQKTNPDVTVVTDGSGVVAPQAKVNTGRWVDVDLIIDRDNARAWISVGGSDYVVWRDVAFLPGSFNGRTWKYLGISVSGGKSTYGAVDDIKICKLAPVVYPKVTIVATVNESDRGFVTINGVSVNELTVYAGSDVVLAAQPTDLNAYKFVGWQNTAGETISSKSNLYLPEQSVDASYTAIFSAYGEEEDRVLSWDFSAYQGDFEVSGVATAVESQGLTFQLTAGDALTGDGLVWANSANNGTGSSLATSKYMTFTPTRSGTLTMKFSVDNWVNGRKPTVVVNVSDSAASCTYDNRLTSLATTAASTEYQLTVDLKVGETYYIWPYSYNWSGANFYHNYTISNIVYTYTPPRSRTFDVAAGTIETTTESLLGLWNVTKTGAGTQVLQAVNDFAGIVQVNEGTLRLANYHEVSTSALTMILGAKRRMWTRLSRWWIM